VYVPGVEELKMHVELDELPDARVTLDPHDALRPMDGVTVVVIVILPEYPPRLVKVNVELPFKPDEKPSEAGFAVMLKSTTVIVNCTVRVAEPLVPVIVTV